MTKKRAMAILKNVNLLQQIAYTWTKVVRYHTQKGKPPYVPVRITKTKAVSMIMNSDIKFNWRSSSKNVTFWTPAKKHSASPSQCTHSELGQRCSE